MNDDPPSPSLRRLPTLGQRADRHQAIGRRAGDAFEEAHRQRVWALATARVALGLALTGAAAAYLLWAMCVARTFG